MNSPRYPEDSTLRRHHESAERFKREAMLSEPPTDSVLKRHHEQITSLRNAQPTSAGPAKTQSTAAPVASNTAAPAAPTRPASATPAAPEPPAKQGGGLLGWLKRLFG